MSKKYVVYTINLQGEVMYVGKTCQFKKRKCRHLNSRGTHRSAIPLDIDLQYIDFEVISEFDNLEEALKFEDELILQYSTIENGWNKQRSGLIKVSREKEYEKDRKVKRKLYRETHKEQSRAYSKKYYQEHREQRNAYQRERRAKLKALSNV